MKNIAKYSFFSIIFLLFYGCSPRYTADFDYASHKHNENETSQTIVEEVNFSKKNIKNHKLNPILDEQLIASSSEQPLLLDDPTRKIVKNYQEKIEEIKSSGFDDKQLKKALKKETKHFKKQLRKELGEKKKNDFGRYLVIGLVVMVVLLLVLLVYTVSKSPH